MELAQLKILLERELFPANDIWGIGTIYKAGQSFIEIAVASEEKKRELEELERELNKKFNIKGLIRIVVRNQTKV
jgi:hypothetical protein